MLTSARTLISLGQFFLFEAIEYYINEYKATGDKSKLEKALEVLDHYKVEIKESLKDRDIEKAIKFLDDYSDSSELKDMFVRDVKKNFINIKK